MQQPKLQTPLPQTDAAEATIRPKVMRRPQQFSAGPPVSTGPEFPLLVSGDSIPEAPLPLSLPALPPAAAEKSPSAAARPWQDDARFGLVMLSLVILANVALMLWLPHMRPKITDPETAQAAAPVVPASETNVTLYRKHVAEPSPAEEVPDNAPTVHVLGETPQ